MGPVSGDGSPTSADTKGQAIFNSIGNYNGAVLKGVIKMLPPENPGNPHSEGEMWYEP